MPAMFNVRSVPIKRNMNNEPDYSEDFSQREPVKASSIIPQQRPRRRNPLFSMLPPEIQQAYEINPDPMLDEMEHPEVTDTQRWRKGFAALAKLGANLGMSKQLYDGAEQQMKDLEDEIAAPVLSAFQSRAAQNLESLRASEMARQQQLASIEMARRNAQDAEARVDRSIGWQENSGEPIDFSEYYNTGKIPSMRLDPNVPLERKATYAERAARNAAEIEIQKKTDPRVVDASVAERLRIALGEDSIRDENAVSDAKLKDQYKVPDLREAYYRLSQLDQKDNLTYEEQVEAAKLNKYIQINRELSAFENDEKIRAGLGVKYPGIDEEE